MPTLRTVNAEKIILTFRTEKLRVLLASLNRVPMPAGSFNDRLRAAVVRELEHREKPTS